MVSRADLINRALAKIGEDPIDDDTSDEARTHLLAYEDVLDDLISRHPWSFAQGQRQLSPLTDPPPRVYARAYRLPVDLVGPPRAVYDSATCAQPFTGYELAEGGALYTDAAAIWIKGAFRPSPVVMPGSFRALLVQALAAEFALSIREDRVLRDALRAELFGTPGEGGHGGMFGQARTSDTQAKPSAIMAGGANPLVDVRGGGRRGWGGGGAYSGSAAPSSGVSDHGGLTGLADDDHPQYLTQERADARYALLGGGGGGVSDHGALSGLADDDHPQYFNTARGDARYDLLGASAAAIAAHLAASDPHPSYLTKAEADALYDPIGGGGGGGGVTDHGALTGLADDDHTQYHTDARGDARYSLLGHNHAGVYDPAGTAAAAVAAHAAASDPHPGYLTQAEGDARYPLLAHTHDHGALTGLADDDHTQYHTDARGDARYAPISAGLRTNLVVNGDFQINQRGFAGGALAAGVYGHDRWKAETGGANYSVSGLVVTLTSGALLQVIEAENWGLQTLNGQTLAISVEDPSADITVSIGANSATITAGSGRRGAAVVVSGTTNATLKIASTGGGAVTFQRVKAEIGPAFTPWLPRSRGDELQLCWRYFQKSFDTVTAPANGTSSTRYGSQGTTTNVVDSQVIQFAQEFRAAPAMTFYSSNNGTPVNGQWAALIAGSWQYAPTSSPSFASSRKTTLVRLTYGGTPATIGTAYPMAGHWTAEAEL